MSVRQSIVNAVRQRLGTILTANGYNTDIGANVLEWQTTPVPSGDLPAVTFRDTDSETEAWTMSERDVKLKVAIEAFGSDVSASVLRNYIEDIYAAIAVDETWGGLALVTEPVSDTIDMRKADEGIGRAQVNITIEYQAQKWEI